MKITEFFDKDIVNEKLVGFFKTNTQKDLDEKYSAASAELMKRHQVFQPYFSFFELALPIDNYEKMAVILNNENEKKVLADYLAIQNDMHAAENFYAQAPNKHFMRFFYDETISALYPEALPVKEVALNTAKTNCCTR